MINRKTIADGIVADLRRHDQRASFHNLMETILTSNPLSEIRIHPFQKFEHLSMAIQKFRANRLSVRTDNWLMVSYAVSKL
jgi:hypothetical protein